MAARRRLGRGRGGEDGILLLVLGVALFATALTLRLLPGPIAACGSLLAPMHPLEAAFRCPGSQNTYFAAVMAGLAGLLALRAGWCVDPSAVGTAVVADRRAWTCGVRALLTVARR